MNQDHIGVEHFNARKRFMPRDGKRRYSTLAATARCVTAAVLWLVVTFPAAPAAEKKGSNDWSELTLEQLVNIEIRSAAGLTVMDSRRTPVTMTELDERDIQQSDARNLNHLVEAYVPNAQFLLHHAHNPHLGIRGIISDRGDEYLYQGNGVTMSKRLLLGDIKSVRMNAAALSRHDVRIVREYTGTPTAYVDKHKVLQILVNPMRNAKYTLEEGKVADKQLVLQVAHNGNGFVRVAVKDNGIGIPPENLTRISSHGFTTRKKGHGFGLHSGALAAKEMDGTLSVQSDGLGNGATFVLELPVEVKEKKS